MHDGAVNRERERESDYAEASVWRASIKKVLWEISQNSQENSKQYQSYFFFDKFRRWSVTSLITKHKNRCFLENFAKFASDYRNTKSSERGTGNGTVIYDTEIKTY